MWRSTNFGNTRRTFSFLTQLTWLFVSFTKIMTGESCPIIDLYKVFRLKPCLSVEYTMVHGYPSARAGKWLHSYNRTREEYGICRLFRLGELLVTARKRSLRRLCFYTCLSFCPRGGACVSHGTPRQPCTPPRQPRMPPRQPRMPPRQPHTPPPLAAMHAPPAATHAPPATMHAPPGSHTCPPGNHACPPGSHACPPGSHARPPKQPCMPPLAATHAPPPAAMHAPPDTGNLHFHCRNTFFTSFFHIYID